MPTIAELEQSLTDAANANDMGAITSIVSSLTLAEKQQINPSVFGYTLTAVANYTMTDAALAASTAGTFMQDVGIYTDSSSITYTYVTFASFGNFAGVNAMVDNTDSQLYNSLDPVALGMALFNVSFSAYADPVSAVATAANFLSHLSLYTDPFFISNTMESFAFSGLLDGVHAVIDNTDPQVYPFFNTFSLGQTLNAIGFAVFSDPEGAVDTTAHFLSNLSLYTDPFAIIGAMQSFAMFGLMDGVNAVIESIDPQVYPFFPPFALGQMLNTLSFNVFADPEGTVETVANFLSHFSLYTDTFAITMAMQSFAMLGVLDGVNAVVDNIDPQVYSSLDPFSLGQALNAVSSAFFSDPDGAVETTANFLSHLSLFTDPNSIASVLLNFAGTGLLDGVNAVVDNTDPLVYPALNPFFLDMAITSVANMTYFLDDHDIAGTLRNFSEALLPYTPDFAIGSTLQSLVGDVNLSAFGGVLDYTTSTQWDTFSPFLSLEFGITVGSYLDDKYLGTGGSDIYFGLGGNDNIDGKIGNDFLFGNAGADKLAGGEGDDFLDGGIGTDVLTGGAGSDTFALNNYDGVDKIQDFDKAIGGDKLDFRDMLSNYDGILPVTDYIHAHSAGINTFVSFDADGAGAGAAIDVAKLQGVIGIDIQALFDQGQILV